jgi:glycerophosphoryl diester phosphodiesterase
VIDLLRRDRRMFRIGHRGAAALAPENTLESIRVALELGCDLVEVDVVELGGELLLAHSLEELPAERATLDDAMALVAPTGRGVQVDLKTPGSEAPVAAALRRHDAVGRTLVSSFHPGSLRALRMLAPGLSLGLTYPADRHGLSTRRVVSALVRPGLAALRAALAARIGRMLRRAHANVAVLHRQVVSQAVITRCHALDVPVLAWTVLSAEEARRLGELGLDGVIVDDPHILQG